ncbi:MAG: cytochrome d ubiquinol oxidase subunit II, partial [Solirubrobacterales bacterium]
MSKADAVAAILFLGATLYAVFGGADFGGGMWDLLAGRSATGERARDQIDRSIAPVWEANHVWLIFCLVVLWTAFPEAFAAIMTTLYIPLALAALGIVLRGSGFAFRHALPGPVRQPATRVFGVSSVLTPFFMGTVVGAIASGAVTVDAGGTGAFEAWVDPLPILVGLLFVASSTYIAAVFLLDDCRRAGDDELADYFSRRAIGVAIYTGVLAAVGLIVVRADARFVFDGLLGEALPLVIASLLLGALTLYGLLRDWQRALRPL